jgi:N6-adenosine-specific RNA methylase IME4
MSMSVDPEELAGTVKCVLADPPWPYENKTIRGGADHHYQTMPIKDIEGFKGLLEIILDPAGCHLWMWTTNSMLVGGEALDVIQEWGFKPKQVITWVKGSLQMAPHLEMDQLTRPDVFSQKVRGSDERVDKLYMVPGVPHSVWPFLHLQVGTGQYTRGATEHLIFATRGKTVKSQTKRAIPNVIVAPTSDHSRKPAEQYGIIEAISPGPRYEMFARHLQPGWEGFGDQLEVGDE